MGDGGFGARTREACRSAISVRHCVIDEAAAGSGWEKVMSPSGSMHESRASGTWLPQRSQRASAKSCAWVWKNTQPLQSMPARTAMLISVLALLVGLVDAAAARCRVVDNCAKTPCARVLECDSSLDPQSESTPQSTGQTLPPGPAATQGFGVLVPRVTPTSQCRQAYICDSAGRCAWQSVCY